MNIPTHIAIIPDGNRRWAKEKKLPISFGHTKGYERIRECIAYAQEVGVLYMTVWAFSTENWKRKENEIIDLMGLIQKGLVKIHEVTKKEKSRVVYIGRRDRLSKDLVTLMETIEEETKLYEGFTLCIAIDYGGEDEIVRAELRKNESNSTKEIKEYLDTSLQNIPYLDLIIRTGGEQRTSGFMPLQSGYAEWVFEEKMLPDFTVEVFQEALDEFASRKRRFGK